MCQFLWAGVTLDSLPSSDPSSFLLTGVSGQIFQERLGPSPVLGGVSLGQPEPITSAVGLGAACSSVGTDEWHRSSWRRFLALKEGVRVLSAGIREMHDLRGVLYSPLQPGGAAGAGGWPS